MSAWSLHYWLKTFPCLKLAKNRISWALEVPWWWASSDDNMLIIIWWYSDLLLSWFDDVHPVTFSPCPYKYKKCRAIPQENRQTCTKFFLRQHRWWILPFSYQIVQVKKLTSPPKISQSFRNDFQRSNRKLIFIAATDNVQWLKRELLAEDDNFVADNIFFSVDLFQYIGLLSHEKGYDLALLSLCNHSIISVRESAKQVCQMKR